MWQKNWREIVWSQLDTEWDMIIVGGGITGAGILLEAVRAGYKVLLVEAQDFAGGTSSRSSKLVHGGFRYLANAQIGLTYESVHERERLLREGMGLVNRLDILMLNLPGNKVPAWEFGLGLGIYSVMAGKWAYRRLNRQQLAAICPQLDLPGLRGAFQYYDANTDDARLTLRVIREAVACGGTALNYAKAVSLLRDRKGRVRGVVLEDQSSESRTAEVRASLVVSATGAWADELRREVKGAPRLRPLQGSHLVFPYDLLPVKQSVSVFHPRDGRPVFTLPWESVTLVGTTDIDIGRNFPDEPVIQEQEVEYLLELVGHTFPEREIGREDVLCTLSGVRPVIDTGKANPSKESREHAIWLESGLMTVTGGKLTTFRLMARDVLKSARRVLNRRHWFNPDRPLFESCDGHGWELADSALDPAGACRLIGRYGADSTRIMDAALPGEEARIGQTPYMWAELRWAARDEGVVHLDDLLLRRIRLGVLLPKGGCELLPHVRQIAQPELGWDDKRWEAESARYLDIWESQYRLAR